MQKCYFFRIYSKNFSAALEGSGVLSAANTTSRFLIGFSSGTSTTSPDRSISSANSLIALPIPSPVRAKSISRSIELTSIIWLGEIPFSAKYLSICCLVRLSESRSITFAAAKRFLSFSAPLFPPIPSLSSRFSRYAPEAMKISSISPSEIISIPEVSSGLTISAMSICLFLRSFRVCADEQHSMDMFICGFSWTNPFRKGSSIYLQKAALAPIFS